MKTRITAAILILLAAMILAWRLAGDGIGSGLTSNQESLSQALRGKGPLDPAYCAPPTEPKPPPPVDSPFGVHLFSTTPLGVVHPVRGTFSIVDVLGQPETEGKSATHKMDQPVNESAFDDVQTVGVLLEEFRRAFGAMPTGELNDEIVRRLQGDNPKGIAVLPKSHPAINGEGELVDRWGTPYRFHPESAWVTTVRSAGPDRKMWTGDDILTEGADAGSVASQNGF